MRYFKRWVLYIVSRYQKYVYIYLNLIDEVIGSMIFM